MSVLHIEQLSIALPAGAERAWAVQDVHVRIEAGQTLCVVGESGSGKSVMATAVMGLLASVTSCCTPAVLGVMVPM
mgnify:CR=1 FL=1